MQDAYRDVLMGDREAVAGGAGVVGSVEGYGEIKAVFGARQFVAMSAA